MLRCTWCLQNLAVVTGWNSPPITQVHSSQSSTVVSHTIWLCKLWDMYVGATPAMLQYYRQVRTLLHTPKYTVPKEVRNSFERTTVLTIGIMMSRLLYDLDCVILSFCRALHSHIHHWLYGLYIQHCYSNLDASWWCRILHSNSARPRWASGNMHVLVIELWHAQTVLRRNIQR